MEIGEIWAYRERVNDRACPLVPAEILKFGPPRSHKVRVRLQAGEYMGLDVWVPKPRLVVEWEAADDWLRDERLLDAVREASWDAYETVEYRAALEAVFVHPMPDGILLGFGRREGALVEIADLPAVAKDLGLDAEELLREPLAFLDRHGTYFAPWPVARRIAMRVAECYADRVLAAIDQKESELQEQAVHGEWVEWSKGRSFEIPPEKCAERLRDEEPVFALVREWCGQPANERFDEVVALRAEVKRLRSVIVETATRLDTEGLAREAARLRKKAGPQASD